MPRPALASLALGALLLGSALGAGEDARVDNFALLDHRGRFHELYSESRAAAVVVFIQGNGCPIARNAVPALEKLRQEFESRGVTFWMLNANSQDDRESVAAEAKQYGFAIPVLIDETQLVAESLGVTRTAEAILIDPKTWRIVYRGPIDDRLSYETQRPARDHYLRDALAAHLDGRPVTVPTRDAAGCLILFEDRDREQHKRISYSEEIAPLLAARCGSCHRDGGVAPWAMTDYRTVRGWSPMMREMIRIRRMPPWHADPHFAHFANDISLSAGEKRTLVHWIEAGAPRGDGEDPLTRANTGPPPGWPLGPPDLIVEAPTQEIPATGVVAYRYETVTVPIEGDVWIRGVDLRPSNARAMHHGIAFLDYPSGRANPRTSGPSFTRGLFAGYVPGREPYSFPKDSGFFLPAGSTIRFQLHYSTTGRPETDTPRMALYLTRQPLAHELKIGAAASFDFEIPPGAEEHEVTAVQRIDRDIVLYRLTPHMHYRGKRMRYEARYPDGSVETLLSVPNYNFNWQRQYVLDPPKRIPAGTRIVVDAAFDNSAQNPANPDPDSWVFWGEQSYDEMLFGYFLYRDADAGMAKARASLPAGGEE